MARGRAKTSKDAFDTLRKEQKALELRLLGFTFQEIAQETGFWKDRRGAFKAISAALKKAQAENKESADELRSVELARLDRYLTFLAKRMNDGDTKSVDSALRIMDRRAKLLGLDAPTKSEVSVTSSMSNEELIAGAVEQLRALGYTVIEPGEQ
jgi:hypothetical protein